MAQRDLFRTVRSEGALLPPDLLQRVAAGDRDLPGLRAEDYHLAPKDPLNEAIVRSWNRLVGAWASFRDERAKLAPTDPGTTLTRERWLLTVFDELHFGRLRTQKAVEIEGKDYPVSHAWENVPIHLIGCKVPLDKRTPGVAGAAGQSPHGLVQELLNRSEERLWGVVSNGLQLRVLRDNASLTRPAYLEFDLEEMMESEAYSDFVVLWLVCHVSRVEADVPSECWLERWSREAAAQGVRALDELREGVEAAIAVLGSGFLAHPRNGQLREDLKEGTLSRVDYYRELLRLVYRLLFLFVAEDRDLLLLPDAGAAQRLRYEQWYSVRRLRHLASRRRGTRHDDLYATLRLVVDWLDDGCPTLGLPALGGLWAKSTVSSVATASISNQALLDAIRALAFVEERRVLRTVDYRNLGAEELGSVYESLLELQPELDVHHAAFSLVTAPGHERQTTGSYYTPSSLISLLLDSTLDPVTERAASGTDPEAALLGLNVCDPACGSGHFLIAAAHRIARRLASVRTGDDEPAPEAIRAALRDVIGHCVYGVDVNPMAVELCKVALWIEALEPGKPLSFLDSHIRVGNSLVGTTKALIEEGVPGAAFKALTLDDATTATQLRKANTKELAGQRTLAELVDDLADDVSSDAALVESQPDSSITEVRTKEQNFQALLDSKEFKRAKSVANAWCAAFSLPKEPETAAITESVVRRAAAGPLDAATASAIEGTAHDYRFFHWELEFAGVMAAGGFDAFVGNPPWGRVKLQHKRFFAALAPAIADAPNKAARDRLIKKLPDEQPALFQEFQRETRRYEVLSQFFHESGRYPLTGVGDVNTYALFAEHSLGLLAPHGRAGLILQTGIVTDDTTKDFFADIVAKKSLVAVYGFENEEKLFPAVHNQTKFCVLAMAAPGDGPDAFELSFFNRQPTTAQDPDRLFKLTPEDVAAINPNTRTCPVFRSSRDAEVLRAIHANHPILIKDGPPEENPWGVDFQTMFHMASDSDKFRTAEELEAAGWTREGEIFVSDEERFLPLLEGKMVQIWNPRFGTYEGQTQAQANKGVLPPTSPERLDDPYFLNRPRYWVAQELVDANWPTEQAWALAWRDVGPLERTFIPCAVPRFAAGHNLPLAHLGDRNLRQALCALAAWSSLVVDYSLRARSEKGRMMFFLVKQLPMPRPEFFDGAARWAQDQTYSEWITSRALELLYTFSALTPLAKEVGYDGPPFRWLPERRTILSAELDASFLHIYGLDRPDAEHLVNSFRLLSENEVKEHGEYRTGRLVLERYDALATAMATRRPYASSLDPPPADPSVAHAR
jgi:hypothetical protein